MSSGYSGGVSDFYGGTNTGRSTIIQFPHCSALSDGASHNLHRRPTFVGKRSLAEFQQQQQFQFLHQQQQVQQGLGFYLRNVKPRNYQQACPISPLSPLDFSANTNITGVLSSGNPNCSAVASYLNQVQNSLYQESEEKMMNQLQELERQLLDDNDEDEDDTISIVTNNEWSETIQNLITPSGNQPSPASSTSSCSSSMESPPVSSPKQSIVDASTAISEGKTNVALQILTRLGHVVNISHSTEQRLIAYMVSALRSRVNSTEYPPPVKELQSKEHGLSSQNLYEVSPCFKLGFMAANLAIIEAVADHPSNKLHVIDFDIGQGGQQYLHLLHALATKKTDNYKPISLKITAITEFIDDRVKAIGNDLITLAKKVGVCFIFNVISCKITDLCREKLGVENDEALAVNFVYKLYRVPDESVTTENLRDELLRRVKRLSPKVVTLVEQELNANTAAFVARVKEACGYYGALLESLDATVDEMGRAKIEEGLSRKIANSVACEGRDRVERCEVFGKWRARMSMAGFGPRPISQFIDDSLLKNLNSGPRVNPGFTVNEQSGGICFGWMRKTLTVASAWC
ncbi:hypothetical protein K7X08_005631 [Anisodus acutangulus]|uniref:Scarecrow-like protein 8 n=1 Tax=Anisodus acutangulus TaxID=402998 RepID=A0A9Q1R563_9SOLA|nr:hypothetical protein K7X08_005631 [Anisodus acutangulus]